MFGPRPVQTTINIVQPVSPNVQLALSIPPMLANLEPVKQHKIACTIYPAGDTRQALPKVMLACITLMLAYQRQQVFVICIPLVS